ncbi:hypothetical protein [uncultured Alcanivorax sp.]|uniref:hypothetical protein n=1 Tax=uncultured Alcanivorax sp. TaxID=191215 RepID=UPI00263725DA|nr:hypothetical protein [uncultured Alcanivorax sp.]
MTLIRFIAFLALLGSMLPAATLAAGDNGLSQGQQQALEQALGPRPDIQNYRRQDQFVTDLLAWQQRKTRLTARLSRGESITPPRPSTPKDWHHVTGPEDLDTAVRNAHGYVQPTYREPIRFNRTTHVSFPLAPLPGQQLADKALSVPGTLPDNHDDEIPEILLEDNVRIQRELSARRTPLPLPTLERETVVNQAELR